MGYLFLALAVLLNAAANVLLKVGAARLGDLAGPGLAGRVLTNPYLLAGVALFALNVAFYLAALTRWNLSLAYPVMVAGGIVVVVSASVALLGEAIGVRQLLGLALLLGGIVLLAGRPLS